MTGSFNTRKCLIALLLWCHKVTCKLFLIFLPRTHAQGVKRLVRLSVIVVLVVGMRIARSRDIGFIASDKYSPTIRIDKTTVLCF